jgi:hypothetical protein
MGAKTLAKRLTHQPRNAGQRQRLHSSEARVKEAENPSLIF